MSAPSAGKASEASSVQPIDHNGRENMTHDAYDGSTCSPLTRARMEGDTDKASYASYASCTPLTDEEMRTAIDAINNQPRPSRPLFDSEWAAIRTVNRTFYPEDHT